MAVTDALLDGLRNVLVDTATSAGMSGAPVIAVAAKEYEVEGPIPAYWKNGRYYRFVGVYSSRLGKGESLAQLGVVWRSSVMAEIVQAGVKGQSSFR